MIVTADRATDADVTGLVQPGALLRADRSLSPTAASDLPLAGGTAATFDIQLATLPAVTLALGVPVGLVSSGTLIRAEQVQVGSVGPLDLDTTIGAAVTTTATPPGDASPFAMPAIDGVAAISIAPASHEPIAVSSPYLPAHTPADSPPPTPGSGTAQSPPVDAAPALTPAEVTPEAVRAMAADVAVAVNTLAEALASVSAGATTQPLATTAATIAAVQAGLAQLGEATGPAVEGVTTSLVSTADDVLTTGTDLVGTVAATAGETVDAAGDAVADVVDAVGETTNSTVASVADTAATLTTAVGAAATATVGAAGDAVTTITSGVTDTATTAVAATTEVATNTAAIVADTVEDTLTGTDPAAGVSTLVDMLQSADGFAIENTPGETIFASVGSALAEPLDTLTSDDADTASPGLPLIDDHPLDGGIDGLLGGLPGGLTWDHDHG